MAQCTFNFDECIDRRQVPALKPAPLPEGNTDETFFSASVADMDFKAPPAVLSALAQRLEHGVFGYERVHSGLMPALVGWLVERHGWHVHPDHVLRSPNVLNTLAMAASLFTDAGDGVIVQPPVFFDFFDIIAENNRRLLLNPLTLKDGRYEMDFDGLESVAADPDARMLYLCNPHNPVGRVWSRAELAKLGEICRRHGVLVVSDEIHGDITFPGHVYTPFASLGEAESLNSITCLSPAKSFNIASCCCAFTVIPDQVKRTTFQAENSRLTVNKNNAFANVAMEAAYRESGPWLDAVLDYISSNVALVERCLDDIPNVSLVEPEGTFLLWFDFRRLGLPPDDLTQFLQDKAGWRVTRGPAFGVQGEGFARVNIACRRASLSAALERLKRASTDLKGPQNLK